MDELMLLGEERQCSDCGTLTVFVPVGQEDWVCTACDCAVTVPVVAA
jgi:hypothetical protein